MNTNANDTPSPTPTTTPTLPDYIKPGAFVQLRDGSKAEIYRTDRPLYGAFAVHGAIDGPAGWQMCNWNGVKRTCSKEDHAWDILGPWIDRPDASKLWPLLPPWIRYIAMDPTGLWCGYSMPPTCGSAVWHWSIGDSLMLRIPPEHNPIFPSNGDWKESLIERPNSCSLVMRPNENCSIDFMQS